MNKPLLSLCVPTRNHATELKIMLSELARMPVFRNGNDIELILSDNCSSDNTQKVCKFYAERFPGKIRYFRNEKDIKDKNFQSALSHGEGLFLKLLNDTVLPSQHGLAKILSAVKDGIDKKNVLFFINSKKSPCKKECRSLDDFLSEVSFNCTWISGFGIWKEDFDNISDFSRESENQLVQVDVLYRLLSQKNGNATVHYINFCSAIPRERKGGVFTIKSFWVLIPQDSPSSRKIR